MSYNVQIIEIGPPIFLHSSPFYPTLKTLCFTILFNQPDTRKLPLPAGTSTFPCNTFVWTHPTHTQKPAFRILRTDNNRGATFYNVRYNVINTPAKKLITAINTIKINELSSSQYGWPWPQDTWAEKRGAAVPLSRGGAGSPSNTMWPGPRYTSVPSGVFIHPAV